MSTDVGTWPNWLTFEPDLDYSMDATTLLSPILYKPCYTRNFTLGKSDVYVLVAAVSHGFTMFSFTEAVSHRNTFVGGTCAPPSALLVSYSMGILGYTTPSMNKLANSFCDSRTQLMDMFAHITVVIVNLLIILITDE